MNYRVQLFPVSELRDLQAPSTRNEGLRFPSVEWGNRKLLRSWAAYDFDFEPTRGRFTRDSLLGLALAIGVGAGFWIAAGLLIARLW